MTSQSFSEMMVIQEEEQQVSSSLSILEEENKCQQQQQLSATSSTVSQSPTNMMAQEEEEEADESNNCTVTEKDNEGTDNNFGGKNDNNGAAAINSSSVPIIEQSNQDQQRRSNNTIINPYKKQTPTTTDNNRNNHDNDPRIQKRKQFIEKYRLQSLNYCHRGGNNNNNINHHHHHRATRGGSGGVVGSSNRANNTSSASNKSLLAASTSALEVFRSHQQWRMQWRRKRQGGSAVGDEEQKKQQQHEEPICQGQGQSCKRDDSKVNNSNRRRRGSGQCALRPRLFLFQKHMLTSQNSNDSTTSQHQHHQQQEGIWELDTGITEISGEGGSGKTQICLSLCMSCALTPLLFPTTELQQLQQQQQQQRLHANANNESSYYTSIYITMGEGIPQSKIASRLHEMLRDRRRRHCSNNSFNNSQGSYESDETEEHQQQQILSRIWLLSLKNEDDFIEFVEVHLPNILMNQVCGSKPSSSPSKQHETNDQYPVCSKIGLVAFDGIANFFRFSDPLFQQNATATRMNNQRSMFHQHRSSKLFQVSSLLRQFSDLYDVPIVITNQVTSLIPSDDGLVKGGVGGHPTSSTIIGGMQNKIQPALGLIWSNCVTTRFILQRKDGVMARISHSKNTGTTSSSEENEAHKKTPTTIMQRSVRKATVLQSVCTPEEKEVWYIIDTGAVVTVS